MEETRARVREALADSLPLEEAAWSACKGDVEAYKDTATALLCVLSSGGPLAAKLKNEHDPAKAITLLARARRPRREKNEKIQKFVQVYGSEPCKNCGNKTVRKRFASARAADEGQVCYFVCHTCKAQWRSG